MRRMLGFYDAAPKLQSSEQVLGAYKSFLVARNGEGFSAREQKMHEVFDATRAPTARSIDGTHFNQVYLGAPVTGMSSDELALLAFVKMNAGEAYGVECVAKAREQEVEKPGVASDVEKLITHEEMFHTRILLGAAGHFDGGDGQRLTVRGAWTPSVMVRTLIGALVHAPRSLFHPVLLGAEIAGVFAFNWMLERLSSLFPEAPAVRESMEQRLHEVLVDEVGHIAFNRVLVGAPGRAVARSIASQVVWAQQLTSPELKALGFDSSVLSRMSTFDLSSLPAEVQRRAFFA
ncbi:MAG: hypothetical protein QM817_31245 [Archangium sp.]